jgi:hypothetical protein
VADHRRLFPPSPGRRRDFRDDFLALLLITLKTSNPESFRDCPLASAQRPTSNVQLNKGARPSIVSSLSGANPAITGPVE